MLTKNLLESIQVVKENERKAAEFYADAAKTAGNSMGGELFEQLSEFEQFHFQRLTELEKQLEASGDFIYYEGKEFPLPPEIVPRAAQEPQHQSIMNIISQALGLERQAEQAYAELARQITDSQGHAMFRKLSEEEHLHYLILNEAYWNLTNLKAWKWSLA